MKGNEAVDKVQPAEVNDNDGFKDKKGKQKNKRKFHRDERMVEAKVADASNQVVTVQHNVNTNDKGKKKQMEESNQVSKVNPGTPVRDKREHYSQETSDTLLNKNLEKGLEEDKSGKEGKEITRPPESDNSGNLLVEPVESAHHGKQDEVEAQADHNSQEEEDLTQNIDDVARETDLSSRSVQKLKQAINKEKPVRNTSVPAARVSTRKKQQVTLQRTHPSLSQSVLVSVVYAKCDREEREELWESMVELANQHDLSWIIGGDFNVIVSYEEKQVGLPITSNETLYFFNYTQSCGLIDVGFSVSKFTWWNGRTEEDCIFIRLDRILMNQQVLDIMPSTTVIHIIRHGFDHAPLHLECNSNAHNIIKSFKNTYGNIFQQIATIEATIKVKELQFETNASRENRMLLHQAQAELTKFLHLEEEYWKQKAGMKWFNDGDINTKFFHSYVRGKRNKLALKRIQDPNGTWLEKEADIGYEAIRIFKSQFSEENSGGDYALLKTIPKLITEEQQKNMEELPSESEVKKVVLSLNGDSPNGPDGFTGHFYQKCWEIIKIDVVQMVRAFFCGFVKGRNIAENVLLAQEIIRDINLRAKHTNMVIKLDMAKAYDRLSWIFLTKVLRQFGFGEVIIDLVWRLLSNNWYSILINGQSHGCFRSSRGLKQGDPLSPTLFIIAAEVLTRSLNKLHEKPRFIGYKIPKWSPQINHLSYADDKILFCSGDGYSLKKMMKRLRKYEKASGQLVNTDKSCYYTHHKVSAIVNNKIKRHTNMRNGSFPFTYFGCPVFYGRRKLIYYEDLIKKLTKRIFSWQNRLLSFGGRYVLVNHVLQTMPVYLMSAMNPPSGVIKQLHKIFAKFFWCNTVGVKRKHWVAWDKLCLPKDEGGIGLRSLTDISNALFVKLWWNFRCGRSFWSSYMLNKYCKKWHPTMAIDRGGSHT
ncbi:uncharacterized protein LOC132637503 [Lycium barbarum]|uniref:uncharacterized protein LOC132637503 n=1 Tax=Lycium barbarum TaxID=112863 RepID=UPI00293ECABC|nr:uncharacterized protein LOC132637503 [Lycium barbarum]